MNIRKVTILTVVLACLLVVPVSAYTGDVNVTAASVNDTRVDPSSPLDFTVGPLLNGSTGNPVQNGFGLDFDNVDDRVNGGSDISLDNLTERTWSAWVYPKDTGSNFIIDKRGLKAYLWITSGPALSFTILYSGDDALATSNEVPPLNRWTLVTGTYSESGDRTPHLYLNGSEVSSYSTSQASTGNIDDDAPGDLVVGGYSNTYSFNGFIDEPQVWNRSIGSGEIEYLFQNKVPLNQSGLVLWYDFDTNVLDQTANGNDGTINGDPEYVRGLRGKADIILDGTGDSIGFTTRTLKRGENTTCFWYKPLDGIGVGTSNAVIGLSSNEFHSYIRQIENGWFAESDTNNDNFHLLNSIPDDNLHHWTVVYNAVNASWYRDGIFIGNGSTTLDDDLEFDTMGVMGRVSGPTSYMNGSLDEWQVYDAILTPEEILGVYNGIYPSSLSFHINFDNNITDQVGTNDGTAFGDPEFSNGFADVPVFTSINGRCSLANSTTGMMNLIQDAPTPPANYTNINVYAETNPVLNATVPLLMVDLFNIDVGALYTELEEGFQTLLYANGSSILDGHELTDGDTVIINGVTFAWNAFMGRFEATTTSAVPTIITFDTLTSMIEVTYGITNGNITTAPTVTWTTSKLDLIMPFMRTGDWPGAIIQINVLLLGQSMFWTFLLMAISVGIYNYSGPEVVVLVWMFGWSMFGAVIGGQALTIALIMMALAGGIYIAKFFLDRRTSV